MKIVYQLQANHIKQLCALYQNETWSKERTQEQTQRCVDGSSIHIGIIDDNGNLAAFTRVLTDGVFKALLFDVIVDEKYRGNNLGSRLVSAVKTHPQLVRVKHFELYCLPELEGFYQKHGFTTDVSNMRLMRYINKTN